MAAWRTAPSSSTANCCARGGGVRSALGASDFLIERVAEDIAERLAVVLRQFDLAVDLGTPGDAVRRALAASGKVGTIVAAESACGDAGGPLAVVADEEALPFRDGAIDLVVSALSLQFANDLPGALVQIRRALRPDGLLLAALARRRHADRAAPGVRAGRGGDRGRDLAAGRAVRRPARARRVAAARRLCAAGHRRRPASPCATRRRSR